MTPGEELVITATVANSGKFEVENLELNIERLPTGWSVSVNPDKLSSLAPRGEEKIEIRIEVPDDAPSNQYDFSVSAKTMNRSTGETVEVQVAETSNNLMVWIGVVAVFTGAVVVLIYARRKWM